MSFLKPVPPWTAGKQYSVWRSLAPETITSMGSTCCSRRILRGGLPQLSVLPIRPGGSGQLSHQLGAGCSNSLLYWVFRCVLLAAHVWNTLLWSPMTRFRAVQAGVCANFQPAGRGARILWVLDSCDAGPAAKLSPSVSAGVRVSALHHVLPPPGPASSPFCKTPKGKK